ncbi:MAG: tRNA (guanosine(37)-N1)-methyltransferase TrmD [Ruminococcaceae bacterium]|nr:tRNA (guanosine(37)-N1)-methyltransferase TrmD [Oscillospiraceae bacterium]
MRFDIMTLFPELVNNVLSESIIGRARQAGIIEINAHNIRDYSKDKHRRVDDTPYGGGMGMLMAAPPVYDCYCDIPKCESCRTVYMSPKGKPLTQKKVKELSGYDQIVILCGHYEGVDQRVLDLIIDEEISIGDYVLTGGEIPACIVVDAVSRLKEGVLSDSECFENESLSEGMLEYPQYTRPYEFMGEKVPMVLLGGNHKEIDKWRFKKALEMTKKQRPDLL